MTEETFSYVFAGGYPTPETIGQAYDDADLNRAIHAYKVFFQAVSGAAIVRGNEAVGVVPNSAFGTMDTHPKHKGLTLNSDTPYGPILLDLGIGPMVVELPPGPLIGALMNADQSWVADLGMPGPDAGNGGKHLFLPPGHDGDVPDGYFTSQAATTRLIGGVRAIPVGGDLSSALARLTEVKVYPLDTTQEWAKPAWLDLTPDPQDTSPDAFETSIEFWKVLRHLVDTEPVLPGYELAYGDLADLGIQKGNPFVPDARMTGILERAAQLANAQMRVQSFADRRPDRVVWPDRQWEWAALRYEDGRFSLNGFTDEIAREKWFYQAIGASPAMFRRGAGSGSLYWLGLKDSNGEYLMGDRSYTLTVPLPVPCKLFWSVTVYDAETRSQIATDQEKAALRSLFELADAGDGDNVTLHFGPDAPAGQEGRWIKTIPGTGWFVYFRLYGPEEPAFDGSWKPGDFEPAN
jgi:hypothetical protein